MHGEQWRWWTHACSVRVCEKDTLLPDRQPELSDRDRELESRISRRDAFSAQTRDSGRLASRKLWIMWRWPCEILAWPKDAVCRTVFLEQFENYREGAPMQNDSVSVLPMEEGCGVTPQIGLNRIGFDRTTCVSSSSPSRLASSCRQFVKRLTMQRSRAWSRRRADKRRGSLEHSGETR